MSGNFELPALRADDGLLAALEDCTLPPSEFTHRQHVRVAFLYLSRLPFGAALDRMRGSLQRYVAHLGKADRYHETVTVAFMALVNSHRTQDAETWESFIERHPQLLDSRLLDTYYSRETLASPAAREHFVLERLQPAGTAATA